MNQVAALPNLMPVAEIKARLETVFPSEFPDRALLVGDMAARVVFVFLYGGFIGGSERFLRPSFIYLFTDEQASLIASVERVAWLILAAKPGFRPLGVRWYADNSRESIRDDLLRNRLWPMGIVGRRSDVATTSSVPVWNLAPAFAGLFDTELQGEGLLQAITSWRDSHLNANTLNQMRLRAAGLGAQVGDVLIDMPDHTRVRVAAGASSLILKAIIEEFAPSYLSSPAVLWISGSDKKVWPQLEKAAASVGLRFSAGNELPDLILADLAQDAPVRLVFCEVVATDGPVTQARKDALMKIVGRTDIPESAIEFLSAFEDRSAGPFRKTFGSLAREGIVWFRSEPDLLVRLSRLPPP